MVSELAYRGHEVSVLSRSSHEFPVDLVSGDGLAKALEGCATGVRHHVCVSIVGCERFSTRYYQVKTE